MKTRVLIIIAFVISIGFTGTAFASEYTGETPLYIFDYLGDQPIAYIIDYKIDGYLRNAVVNFGSNTIIFEIKDDGILTVEIPKTHFLPNDYFPTLLINKVNEDPREFLVKDEECFKGYEFSVDKNTTIELIMEKSSDVSSIINENILVNCQNKINNEITNTFDFNTIFEDDLEYTIIDGKQYLSKTIKSSLAHLTHDETIFELSEIKFHFYDKREGKIVFPGMGMMGLPTPVLFEFPDGGIAEMSIKTTTLIPQALKDKEYTTMEIFSRPNWPEVGVLAGLTPSNQITKLLVFEKNISPHVQLQFGIDSIDISCKVGLERIQKHDGSPACVKPETKTNLIERGWSSMKVKSDSLHLDENSNNLVPLWMNQIPEKIPVIAISDDNSTIIVGTKNDDDGTGKIYLFDSKGNRLWDKIFDRMVSGIKMSSDGSYIAVSGYQLSGGGGGSRANQNGAVYLFDSDGNQLWDYFMEGNNVPGSLFVYPDGSGVSFGVNNKILSLDKQGKVIWQTDIEQHFNNVEYSHDGDFVISYDSELAYFDNTGKQLWNFTTKNNFNYATIISHDGKNVITSDSNGTDGKIYYLDSDGNLLWEHHLDEAALRLSMPQDDSYLVASNNWQSMMFDTNADIGNLQWTNNIPSHIQSSSDGSFLVGITHNQVTGSNVTFFDNLGNIISNHAIVPHNGMGMPFSLSKDDRYLAVAGEVQPQLPNNYDVSNNNNDDNYSSLSFFEIKEDILNQDILYDLSEMQESSELHIEIVAPKDDDHDGDSFDIAIRKGDSLEIPWDIKLDDNDNYTTANFGVSIVSSSPDLQSWITPDKPYRTTNGIPPGEKVITIHPTLNTSFGNYTVNVLGHGHSVHQKTGWMTDLEGKSLATIDVSVIPNDNQISIETGPVHYERQSFCLDHKPINDDGDGGGQFCQGGPTYQKIPITVSSEIPQTVHLDASVVQQERGWIKFVPEEIVAGPDGATTEMIMAGFLVPFRSNPSADKSLIISVSSENDYDDTLTTTVIPVRYDGEISVINNSDDNGDNSNNNDISNSIKLNKIRTNSNGANFGVTGTVYDSPAEKILKNNDDVNTLSVTLSVLGMWNNDDETITELPEWLSVNIPEPSFVLNAYKPHHFMISAKTINAPSEPATYFVAINQTIGEQDFVELQEITIENRR